jgi:hypothetical protein
MVDPFDVTDYHRTEAQLQEFLLFTIVAAGKKATNQAEALERFLGRRQRWQTPFQYLTYLLTRPAAMHNALLIARLGQYTRIGAAFSQIALAFGRGEAPFCDLHTVRPADLEAIHGIGPKTARFFILHTQQDAQVACLDTHVLKFLAARGVSSVPKYTPTGQDYARLEQAYLRICHELMVDPAQFDLAIWSHYAGQYRELRQAA